MNEFTTCTLDELWEIHQTCWCAVGDDDRVRWQKAKDDLESAELKRQKEIMHKQASENYQYSKSDLISMSTPL